MPQSDSPMTPSPQSAGLQRQRIKPAKSLEGFWHVPVQKAATRPASPKSVPQPQVKGAQVGRLVPTSHSSNHKAVTPLPASARKAQRASATAPSVQPAADAQPQRAAAATPQAKTKRSKLKWLLMPLYAILAMAGGLLVQSLIVGQILLAIYALFAWIRKVPSGTTFLIALITFGATVLFFTLHQNGQQAQNFAVYTFWIVVIGTISMILEIRRDKKIRRLRNREAHRI